MEQNKKQWQNLFSTYVKYILDIADEAKNPLITKKIKKKLFDFADEAKEKGLIININKKGEKNETICNQK